MKSLVCGAWYNSSQGRDLLEWLELSKLVAWKLDNKPSESCIIAIREEMQRSCMDSAEFIDFLVDRSLAFPLI